MWLPQFQPVKTEVQALVYGSCAIVRLAASNSVSRPGLDRSPERTEHDKTVDEAHNNIRRFREFLHQQ